MSLIMKRRTINPSQCEATEQHRRSSPQQPRAPKVPGHPRLCHRAQNVQCEQGPTITQGPPSRLRESTTGPSDHSPIMMHDPCHSSCTHRGWAPLIRCAQVAQNCQAFDSQAGVVTMGLHGQHNAGHCSHQVLLERGGGGGGTESGWYQRYS